MEVKKTTKADLENKRSIFVQLGLVLSMLIVLYAFNISKPVKSFDTLGEVVAEAIEDEVIPITRQEEQQPPPPPPPPQVIEIITIIDDDVQLDHEFEFESTEANKFTIIDAIPVIDREEDNTDETEIFVIVEDMPEFPGGEAQLRRWLGSNVKYPVIAAENGIQGRVYVQFVVDTNGSITNARVARGVDPSLDQEALRVVNSMPKWKPGMQRGKAVRVSYTVPINFQLQ